MLLKGYLVSVLVMCRCAAVFSNGFVVKAVNDPFGSFVEGFSLRGVVRLL